MARRHNKKHFFLFVLYASVDVVFVCATSFQEVLTFHSGAPLVSYAQAFPLDCIQSWLISVQVTLPSSKRPIEVSSPERMPTFARKYARKMLQQTKSPSLPLSTTPSASTN